MCKGRTCLILDDIIDTAGTMVKTVEASARTRARAKVYACASRMRCFRGPAVERHCGTHGWKQLVVSNTIPLREDAPAELEATGKIKVLSIAGPVGPGDREHSHGDQRFSTLFN